MNVIERKVPKDAQAIIITGSNDGIPTNSELTLNAASSTDELTEEGNYFSRKIVDFRGIFFKFFKKHNTIFRYLFITIIISCVIAYLSAAVWYYYSQGKKPINWCEGNGMVLILFFIIFFFIIYYKLLKKLIYKINQTLKQNAEIDSIGPSYIIRNVKRTIIFLIIVGFLIYAVIDASNSPRRLVSLFGFCSFILVGFVLSKYPNKIKWETVFMGILLQIVTGMIIIRWAVGRAIFMCIGERVEYFLNFANNGSAFVFGDFIVNHLAVFAFKSLSVIYFLSMITEVLFHLGWMQLLCFNLGWFIQCLLGTTIIESVNAVTTVFLGMSEAPLLYKPYIKDLTKSEVHAVMAGGFSTVAGSVFAAYTAMGVNPAYIITASVMAAPAALCFAKLTYPETEVSKTESDSFTFYESDTNSIPDAACKGALAAINIVLGVCASIIACVSFMAFMNTTIAWLAEMVGVEGFTFEFLVGKILIPIPYLMGVIPEQCEYVAKLIGVKMTLNEFIAYRELQNMKKANLLSPRSEAIATFALCSFANPGSLGSFLAVLINLCPSQKQVITKVSIRAFLSGSVTSLLTACIAGTLIPEEGFNACDSCVTTVIVNNVTSTMKSVI